MDPNQPTDPSLTPPAAVPQAAPTTATPWPPQPEPAAPAAMAAVPGQVVSGNVTAPLPEWTPPPAPSQPTVEVVAPPTVWEPPHDPLGGVQANPLSAAPPAPQPAPETINFNMGADQMPSSTGWSPPALSSNDVPASVLSQPESLDWQRQPGQEAAPAPMESGPTDFSNMAIVPPEAGQVATTPPPVTPAEPQTVETHPHSLSKWMLAAGGLTVLLIAAVVVYFILGVGKTTSSLPAVVESTTTETSQPGTFLPADQNNSPLPTTVVPTASATSSSQPSGRELLLNRPDQ